MNVRNKFLNLIREKRLPDFSFWLRNLSLLKSSLQNEKIGAWHVIHQDPLIIYIMPMGGPYQQLFRYIGHRKTYFFLSNPWIPRDRNQAIELREEIIQHQTIYPEYSFLFLCNDSKEADTYRDLGLEAYFCNQNCFIDESIFKPLPHIQKEFDALYDAQIVPYKRHELAIKITNLALNGYLLTECNHKDYTQYVQRNFTHCHWLQNPFNSLNKLQFSDSEIAQFINKARCGLCLSAHEGGMYASMQYLLCGLPIVSTKSIGGRDVFFNEQTTLIVEDTPEAVQEGVDAIIHRNINPNDIRAITITAVEKHRQTFKNIIATICDRNQVSVNPNEIWSNVFRHKMTQKHPYKNITKILS